MIRTFLSLVGLIAVGVIGRIVPHMPNATPLTAITVAAQRYVGSRTAVAVPLVSMLVADSILGWYDLRILASVYLCMACTGIMSIAIRTRRGIVPVTLLLMCSSTLFFLVTNGAVWAFSPWYEKSFTGLLYAYELGFPFFRSMLLGDLIYTPLVLGAMETIRFVQTHRASRPLWV